jgi:peptidoglycan/LPS O-acetylase OafA/YrhL
VAQRSLGLDLVRATAIGLVLVDHGLFVAVSTGAVAWSGWVRFVRPSGYLGVEVFFVLSGYLIGRILQSDHARGEQGWVRGFWIRRWMRTLPAYYVAVAVYALVAWTHLGEGRPAWPYLLFLQNLTHPPQPFFFESWSLASEEMFYLTLPILLVAATALTARRARAFRAATLAFLVGSFAIRLAATLAYHDQGAARWDLVVPFIAPVALESMAWGVLAGTAWPPLAARAWPRWTGTALVAAGTLAFVLLRADVAIPAGVALACRVLSQTLVALGTALLLPAFAQMPWRMGAWGRAVEAVSLHSYSLYLLNIPLAFLVIHTAGATHKVGPVDWVWVPVWLVAVAAAARASYLFIESPGLRLRERWTRPSKAEPTPPPPQA